MKHCCLAFVSNKIRSMHYVGRRDSYKKIFFLNLWGNLALIFSFILNIQNTH